MDSLQQRQKKRTSKHKGLRAEPVDYIYNENIVIYYFSTFTISMALLLTKR